MDPSLAGLPYIDTHRVRVDAPGDAVWAALLDVMRRTTSGSGRFARILGCEPAAGTAAFAGRPGEAVPGFRVVESEPGRRLMLRGRHRFADYALTFRVDDGFLSAETHAAFPHLRGSVYRAAVISSGAHGLVTRRMLSQMARAASLRYGAA